MKQYGQWIRTAQTAEDIAKNRVTYVRHHEDGSMDIHVVNYVDDVLEANDRMRAYSNPHDRFGEFAHIAEIPTAMFFKMGMDEAMRQHDDSWMRKILNDSDYRRLKVTDKKL